MYKKIVILGAGYAGMRVATQLEYKMGDFKIILIDQNSYHTEKACLHEVVTGYRKPESIIYPIEDCLNKQKGRFIQDKVIEINKEENCVTLEKNGKINYDYLVVALGSEAKTCAIKGLEENAFTLSSLEEAVKINEHIKKQIKSYLQGKRDKTKLKILVCGAGLTGIELLGLLAEQMPKYAVKYGFSENSYEILCLDCAKKLLPNFSEKLSEYALNYLTYMGIKFITEAEIKEVKKDSIEYIKDGKNCEINAGTIIFTIGTRVGDIVSEAGLSKKGERVKVKDDLTVEGYENIFVLGDLAWLKNPQANQAYQANAQIALEMASTCARNILKKLAGKETESFVYKSEGLVCSLGNTNAVAELDGKEKKGYQASALKKIITTKAVHSTSGKIALALKKGKLDLYR